MKKFFTTSLLLLLFCLVSKAQYNIPQNKVWALGYHAGVSFNSGTPVPITTNMSSFEGTASVCDSTGALLFYTDGNNIWSGVTNTIIPYGAILNGGGNNTSSTTQGALIVPDPGNYNRYYVFSQSAHPISNLFVNVVDMTLNNGIGAVDTGFDLRGVMIGDSLSEKMIAVKGCNDNVWVVVHSRYDTTFMSYLITPFGINVNPVISATGGGMPEQYTFRVMKGSPDRTKIMVSGSSRLELFDFNYQSGMVSNPKLINSIEGGYGGAFSPDGTKYYSAGKQYDLSAPNPSATGINLSVTIVSDMRLGPDGKIYFKSPTEQTYTFLGRINNPNAAGLACNVQDSVTSLAFPLAGLTYGFPQEVVVTSHTFHPNHGVVMDTLICKPPPGGLTLNAPLGTSFRVWDDGSNASTRTITEAGVYHVFAMSDACKSSLDSFIIRGMMAPAGIVFNDPLLSTTHEYDSYQWFKNGAPITGGTDRQCFIASNGWYTVVVHDEWGCTDSTGIQISTFTGIEDVSKLQKLIKIYPNPANDLVHVDAPFPVRFALYNVEGKVLLSGKGKLLNIAQLASGLYLLHVEDEQGRRLRMEKISKL
jgi:hypothetical protein